MKEEDLRLPPERRQLLAPRKWEVIAGFLFISPWLIGFVLLKLAPILTALYFSFTDFYMLEPGDTQFIGLANYAEFFRDPNAGASLFGSLGYFLVTVPLEMAAALGLALFFSSERMQLKVVLRSLFFLPSVLPAIAIFAIWAGISNPANGWLTRLIIEPLGLPGVGELFSGAWFNLLLTMFALWSIGPGFLIMYGALQGIPREIYEAARVDGAGPFARLVFVTLPMISPAIFFSLVINLTGAFGGALLLDRGYVFGQSLSPMEGYINFIVFSRSQLGYGSALAWIMLMVVMSLVVLLFRSARKWVYFPEEHDREEY